MVRVSLPSRQEPELMLCLAVILLNELERAHRDVAIILLQTLDEGNITDNQGLMIDFKVLVVYIALHTF
jgi:ATP-dependent Clp protease ATP-binding subunit ClpA